MIARMTVILLALATTHAHARGWRVVGRAVVGQEQASWTATLLEKTSDTVPGDFYMRLELTAPGKQKREYGVRYGGLVPNAAFVRPAIAAFHALGENLLQLRLSDEGDVSEDYMLMTDLRRVAADGSLTLVFSDQVMMVLGGRCRRTDRLSLVATDKDGEHIDLVKRYTQHPKAGWAEECGPHKANRLSRSYSWTGKCYRYVEQPEDFGTVSEHDTCDPERGIKVDNEMLVPISP